MAQHIEILIKHPTILTEQPSPVFYIPEIYDALASLQDQISPPDAHRILSEMAIAAYDYGPPKAGCSYLDLLFGDIGNKPLLSTPPSIEMNPRMAAVHDSFGSWEKLNPDQIHTIYPQLGLGLTEDEEALHKHQDTDTKTELTRVVSIADYILHRGIALAITNGITIPTVYTQAADQTMKAWDRRLYFNNRFASSIAEQALERLVQERDRWNF